ncbi:ABC transporter permease [Paenibacillus sambharensis]|nr:ABC transporter permease [Paenibacillus sambharensis]
MVPLAFKLLMARKKWFLTMVISFAVVLTSVTTILSSSRMIQGEITRTAIEQYGQFSCVLLDKPKEQADDSYGQFVLTGSIQVSESRTAAIGWVNSEYMDLGHLKLTTGRLPVTDSEVAIERHYLALLDADWQVGTAKQLIIDGEPRLLQLTGIVDNYSARWSVDTRKTTFPNLFVSSVWAQSNTTSHWLIPYNQGESPKINETKAYQLINTYDRHGFINDHLFQNGLRDLGPLAITSVFMQTAVLIISLLSIVTLQTFYQAKRHLKYAVLKSLGGTTGHLYKLGLLQTTFIYFIGAGLAVPLTLLLQSFMLKGIYTGNLITGHFSDSFRSTLLWVSLLYVFMVSSSCFAIWQHRDKSMKEMLAAGTSGSSLAHGWIAAIRSFRFKQLLRQMAVYPQQTFLSFMTITVAIIVLLFANVFAREAAGIGATDIDYYLSAQETIYSTTIDGHTVLLSQDLTYSPDEVKRLEALNGVALVIKEPSMQDVRLSIQRHTMTPSLQDWIAKYSSSMNHQEGTSVTYQEEVILPNVRYMLRQPVKGSPSPEDAEVPSVMLYIQGMPVEECEKLTGSTLKLSKSVLDEDGNPSGGSWNFLIAQVRGEPYQESTDHYTITHDEITIVLDEAYALEQGITRGYRDLSIYTKERLTVAEKQQIYDQVYALAAGTPGGLFQHVPDLLQNSARMSSIIYRLGAVTFYTALILSLLCLAIVMYGKYQQHRRYWGIYRSLGMRLIHIHSCLLVEMLAYFMLAALISAGFYALMLLTNNLSHPTIVYMRIFVLVLSAVLTFIIGISLLVKRRIGREAIAAKLRIEE